MRMEMQIANCGLRNESAGAPESKSNVHVELARKERRIAILEQELRDASWIIRELSREIGELAMGKAGPRSSTEFAEAEESTEMGKGVKS